MDQLIPAIFDSGVFRPLEPVELAEGTQVQVQVPQTGDAKLTDHTESASLSWPEFVAQTYGSCVGLGLERPEQGEFEERDPII